MEIKETIIKQLNQELESLSLALTRSQETSSKLKDLVNSEDIIRQDVKELSLVMADTIKTVYYVRNEMLYHNTNIIYEKASYRAAYIYLVARKFNINPWLVTAVIIAESNFYQTAKSEAGAIGVMQLMPRTARIYNVNPNQFEENLAGGVRFIRDLMNQYKGDAKLVLAHYNGGSRPYYALKHYEETQNYVKKVLNLYNAMNEKYED